MTAPVGNTAWAAFHVDLAGSDLRMTGEPDNVPPLARVVMPDLQQRRYRAYPLADHVADKVCAITERHGPAQAPSPRFRDLVAITIAAPVDARPQITALVSEASRRGLTLPQAFAVPDRALWEPGYAAEAGRSLLPAARTLDQALATVTPFLDPLLNTTASGTWNPLSRRWTS